MTDALPDVLQQTVREMLDVLLGVNATIGYMSTPITTGLRELMLASELGAAAGTSREVDEHAWRDVVLAANMREAEARANELRHHHVGIVLNPAALTAPAPFWSQDDWGRLWNDVIFNHVSVLYLSPGWQYSDGCRKEVEFAVGHRLPIFTAWQPYMSLAYNPTYDTRQLQRYADEAELEWPAAHLHQIDWKR